MTPRELQRLTGAGLGDCRRAIDYANKYYEGARIIAYAHVKAMGLAFNCKGGPHKRVEYILKTMIGEERR